MNGVRQFVAISFVLIANEYAKRRKLILFSLLVLIAFGFHNTAIFSLCLWWLYKPHLKKKTIILVFLCVISGIVAFERFIPIISRIFPRYMVYLTDSSSFESGGIMAAVVFTLISLVGLAATIDKKWKDNQYNYVIVLVVCLAAILSIGSISIGILRRVCWMFEVYSIVLIPNIMNSRFYSKSKVILSILIVIAGIIYMLYCFSFNWNYVLPYKFYFT